MRMCSTDSEQLSGSQKHKLKINWPSFSKSVAAEGWMDITARKTDFLLGLKDNKA